MIQSLHVEIERGTEAASPGSAHSRGFLLARNPELAHRLCRWLRHLGDDSGRSQGEGSTFPPAP
jgi:hypothetical protein